MKRWSVFGALVLVALFTKGQRTYVGASVLSTGRWIKLSTIEPGIYRVNGEQLKAAGFTAGISSDQLRLFGNAGGELPEDNGAAAVDDLQEVSIELFDGGDGRFDANDYFLFYAGGPHQWVYDEAIRRYRFRKNHYSNKNYFFLQLSAEKGKRVPAAPAFNNPVRQVNAFYEHYRHELDSFNFLKSGKEWYGEDLSNQPGRKSTRDFLIPFTAVPGKPLKLISDLAGRGFGQVNRIPVLLNGKPLLEHQTLPLVGTNLEPSANPSREEAEPLPSSGSLQLSYQFNGSGVNAEAWLNWFEVHGMRNLDMQGLSRLQFRDTIRMQRGQATEYVLTNPSANTRIWDITHPLQPLNINFQSGNPLRFVQENTQIKEFLAFDANQTFAAFIEGPVANQNLHGASFQDMIIVADKELLEQAERLAAFHRERQGLKVLVVQPEKIYHEFSTGMPDPSAIRNFLKMFYDRAAGNSSLRPQYLLLFGGASYVQLDSKSKGKNNVPSYQSASSLDPLTSYVTDDYFGFLDDDEDINRNLPAPLLDIGIGRIPARTIEQARNAVDKIIHYHALSAFGSWRNNITLVADDEDFNLHLNDAEQHAALIASGSTAWNLQKIYLDAFVQEGGTAGSFYPGVNKAITKNVNSGTLVWNYSGHGGSTRLAQESVLDKNMISLWENKDRLPLFITATCDFAPFDDPGQSSIGEELLMARPTGAIALMTTTRLVFASSNKIINNNFLQALLSRNSQGEIPALGQALMQSKNYTVQNSGDFINARKFIMLGDPAMKPAIPAYKIQTLSINGKLTGAVPDTIRAQAEYLISGEVLRPDGSPALDFNGDVYPKIFDKPIAIKSLANDPQSTPVEFLSSETILYNGKVKAVNGRFSFGFIAPKDMNLTPGKGRISYYANDNRVDAAGGTENIITGGIGNTVAGEKEGPTIRAYLDSPSFKNGDVVASTPLLSLELSDASGINLTGSLGHEILLVVDGDPQKTFVLNDLFSPLNGNLSGGIQFRLPALEEGNHSLVIRAWDVFNNSSTMTLQCQVKTPKAIQVLTLQTIPNPVRGQALFKATLNGPTQGAEWQLSLFTIGGQMVRSFEKTINEPSLRSIEIVWDGRDQRGNALGSGVYVYVLRMKTLEGIWTQKHGRLVVL